ncbi:MAG: prepilin-type N-terminal cleavage/methylation domain-containing protein [Elusimicrobiaceae bacterium]|nr:prepilin-type N-terminal cleavage/methylation domain-containing protein [Elusimicrobiaceae bacterium]
MKHNENVVICPPCGENVALATKRGANKENLFGALLPRLTAVLPPQGWEITTHGFTLIELLVVVLIIGILAAVALPQYRIAVAKSQLATVKNLVKSIQEAQDIYYTANGKYATTLDELDVSYPNSSDERNTSSSLYYKNFYCWIQDIQTICNITTNIGELGYQQSYRFVKSGGVLAPGSRRCTAFTTDLTDPANKLCKAETGDTNPTGKTWRSWEYKK